LLILPLPPIFFRRKKKEVSGVSLSSWASFCHNVDCPHQTIDPGKDSTILPKCQRRDRSVPHHNYITWSQVVRLLPPFSPLIDQNEILVLLPPPQISSQFLEVAPMFGKSSLVLVISEMVVVRRDLRLESVLVLKPL